MRDLTEREVMQAIRAANLGGDTIRLTYDSGPYEVSKPTHAAVLLARLIVSKFIEVNNITDGVQEAPVYPAIYGPNGKLQTPTASPVGVRVDGASASSGASGVPMVLRRHHPNCAYADLPEQPTNCSCPPADGVIASPEPSNKGGA